MQACASGGKSYKTSLLPTVLRENKGKIPLRDSISGNFANSLQRISVPKKWIKMVKFAYSIIQNEQEINTI